MAEKYGTVPKRFTKEWWSWYWMYHKGITLGAIFLLILIIIGVYDNLTQEKYDVTLTYGGSLIIPDSYAEKAEKLLSPLCEDIDNDGAKSLYVSRITIDTETTDAEFLRANMLKLDMAIGEENTYLFVLEGSVAARYIGENEDACGYAPLEDWVTEDISGIKTYDAHGKAYGIAVSDLKLFKDLGMDQEDYYLFMRYYPRKEQLKEHKKGYDVSVKLANNILQKNK